MENHKYEDYIKDEPRSKRKTTLLGWTWIILFMLLLIAHALGI